MDEYNNSTRQGGNYPQPPIMNNGYQPAQMNGAPVYRGYTVQPVPAQSAYGYAGVPQPAAGYANAYPVFYPGRTPKDIEKESLRRACNSGAKLSIAAFVTMIAVSVILALVCLYTGVIDHMPNAEKMDLGMSPMGYYLLLGLASLLGCGVPAFIVIASSKRNRQMVTEDFVPFGELGAGKTAALVFAGMGMCMIAQIGATAISFLLRELAGIDIESAVEFTSGTTVFDLVMDVITIAIIPALIEEFCYRGALLGVIAKYDTSVAIIGSAFLFGMGHGTLAQAPFAFILGLVFGYIRVKSGSLLPTILIHFGNNFYAVVVSHIALSGQETAASVADIAITIVLLIAGVLSLYHLSKTDKDFFKLEKRPSYLTMREKLGTFFTSGGVITVIVIMGFMMAFTFEMV